MKLNIANPSRGIQKTIEISELALQKLVDKKIGDMFDGSLIQPDLANFTLKITGGDDFQGFPMKTRVNTANKVSLLLKKGEKGYRCRRSGCKKRKYVRGCIISKEIAVVSCVVLSEGENVVEGINDRVVEQSHLPKRADKLRKMFDLGDDVNVEEAVKKIISENMAENGKMPRVRVTRVDVEKKKRKIMEEREIRKQRQMRNEEKRKAYEAKYLKK